MNSVFVDRAGNSAIMGVMVPLFGRSSAVLALSLIFLLSAAVVSDAGERPVAKKGVIDLRSCDFDASGPVPMDGEWAFYWGDLVDEGNFFSVVDSEPDYYVEVPGYWSGLQKIDPFISPYGTATYVIKIITSRADLNDLALKFLNVTPNAAVYVDGVRLMESGVVDSDRRDSKSGNRPRVLPFSCPSGTVVLAVAISNFHNVSGGLNRHVLIGTFDDLIIRRERVLVADSLFMGGLLLMGLYQVAVFLLDRRRKAPLYMAALCLLTLAFSGVKNEMALIALFPGWDGEIRTKLIYLTLSLAPAAFSLYISDLYPAYFKKKSTRFIVPVSVAVSIAILVTRKSFYTRLTIPLEILILGAGAYNIVILVLGYFRTREGRVLAYIGGLALLLISIAFGILDNAASVFVHSASGVFFVFILYQAFLQAYVFSHAFHEIDNLAVQKTKLEKRNVELFSLSYIDNLTGVCNRRLMDDFLASNWRVNSFTDRPLGMILIDIDHLKFFNDYYGHRKGDLCIKEVCELVRSVITDDDGYTLARYGGDEFALITSDSDELNLFRLAERIRMTVESGGIEHAASSSGVVTVSLGCASMVPNIGQMPEVLLDAADRALNNAKVKGRNRSEVEGFGGERFSWGPRSTD